MRAVKTLLCAGLACSLALAAACQDTNSTPKPAGGQPPGRTQRVLSLDECLQLALQNNLDIALQKYNPILAQYGLNGLYSVYEPTLTVSATKSYTSSPGGFDQNGLPIPSTERDAENYNANLSGALPSGLTYNINGPLSSLTQSRGGTNIVPETWSANPGINMRQPLLKNFWIDNNRLQIRLNKADIKISEQALRQQVMATITTVKTAYYNLIFSRENVEVTTRALELAQELASQNKMKVQIGTLAPLDEKQAESQAQSSQASLLAARHALTVQENALKSLLTGDYTQWAETSPVPAEKLVVVPRPISRQESWRRAIEQRPDLIQAKLNLDKENITLKFTYNQLFPQLDLTGSYGQAGFSTSLGTTLDNVGAANDPFYSYGAILTVPLGNTAARNSYRTTKVTVQQRILQVKQLENLILSTVDNDVGQVESSLQQVGATRAARVYAEEALSAEQKKLENGKSTSFNVLQLISNLTAAESAEIRALADYNIAVNQLSLDEGSALEENHIEFKVK